MMNAVAVVATVPVRADSPGSHAPESTSATETRPLRALSSVDLVIRIIGRNG